MLKIIIFILICFLYGCVVPYATPRYEREFYTPILHDNDNIMHYRRYHNYNRD